MFAVSNMTLLFNNTELHPSQWQIASWLEKSNPKIFQLTPLYSCNRMMVIITTALTYVSWHEQSCVSSTSMYRNFYCTWKKCFTLVPSHQLELGYGYQKPHVMHTRGSDSVPTERAGKTWLVQTSVCVLEVEDKAQHQPFPEIGRWPQSYCNTGTFVH